MGRHKVDRLGCYQLCRHAEITFIFTILIIDKNDHLAGFDIFYYFLYRTDCHNKLLFINIFIF